MCPSANGMTAPTAFAKIAARLEGTRLAEQALGL